MRAGEKAVLVANISLFLFACVSFFFLPETIVHHWGFDGPDRIGGRHHIFRIPLPSSAVSVVSLLFYRWYEKKDPVNGEVVRYVMLMQCIIVATVCMISTLIILAYNV